MSATQGSTTKMDDLTACLICEGVMAAGAKVQVSAWQHLIDNGTVWSLQGWYQRTALGLIEQGICHDPHTDTEEIYERRY
jgi:hypothetical protein